MEELKNCDCGGEVYMDWWDGKGQTTGDYFNGIKCKKCGFTFKERSQFMTIKNWNQRVLEKPEEN